MPSRGLGDVDKRQVVALADITARLIPLPTPMATAWLGLAAVPLLGSLITEPAAMTIAALMLAPQIFRADVPEGRKYLALGVLFVNVASGRRTWAEHWKLQNALVLFNPAPVT